MKESRRARRLRRQIDTIGFCPTTPMFLHDLQRVVIRTPEEGKTVTLFCRNCPEERPA